MCDRPVETADTGSRMNTSLNQLSSPGVHGSAVSLRRHFVPPAAHLCGAYITAGPQHAAKATSGSKSKPISECFIRTSPQPAQITSSNGKSRFIMAIIKKCANCGSVIAFGKKDGDNYYCNNICKEHHKHPGFCQECVAETTNETPGDTATFNGVGIRLYGNAAKCPTCYSVIKRKWFCIVFIPIFPLRKFRIKPVTIKRYLGRRLPDEMVQISELRAASHPIQ